MSEEKSIKKFFYAAEKSSAQRSSPDMRQQGWWVTTLTNSHQHDFNGFISENENCETVETFADLEPLLMRILSRMVSVQKYHTNRKLKRASKALKQKHQSQTCKLPSESEGTFRNMGASIFPEYRPNAVTTLCTGRELSWDVWTGTTGFVSRGASGPGADWSGQQSWTLSHYVNANDHNKHTQGV